MVGRWRGDGREMAVRWWGYGRRGWLTSRAPGHGRILTGKPVFSDPVTDRHGMPGAAWLRGHVRWGMWRGDGGEMAGRWLGDGGRWRRRWQRRCRRWREEMAGETCQIRKQGGDLPN